MGRLQPPNFMWSHLWPWGWLGCGTREGQGAWKRHSSPERASLSRLPAFTPAARGASSHLMPHILGFAQIILSPQYPLPTHFLLPPSHSPLILPSLWNPVPPTLSQTPCCPLPCDPDRLFWSPELRSFSSCLHPHLGYKQQGDFYAFFFPLSFLHIIFSLLVILMTSTVAAHRKHSKRHWMKR